MNRITVGQYGRGECETIQEAFNIAMSMTGHVDIYIMPGIYDEKAILERNDVTIIGENANTTVITYDDYAKKLLPDGSCYGTFRTATLMLSGNNIIMKNITVINRSGNGRDYGQAIALYSHGDRMQYYGCRFLGAQDTLFVGPGTECRVNEEAAIPPELHTVDARQYFKNCYIRGDIDFIFGGATAYFNHCEIFSQYNITEDDEKYEGKVKGYATAACTWRDNRYGFVFRKCKFTGDCPENSVYLGRPWRIYAQTVLIDCEIGRHIKAEGWSDWGKKEARQTAFFAEYNCTYESVARRGEWIHRLSREQARDYTMKKVLWEYFCED